MPGIVFISPRAVDSDDTDVGEAVAGVGSLPGVTAVWTDRVGAIPVGTKDWDRFAFDSEPTTTAEVVVRALEWLDDSEDPAQPVVYVDPTGLMVPALFQRRTPGPTLILVPDMHRLSVRQASHIANFLVQPPGSALPDYN